MSKTQKRPPDFTHAGKPGLRLERAVSHSLPFVACVPCICCGQVVAVAIGEHVAMFRVGSEIVGIVCECCLSPESRATLAEMRHTGTVSR